MPAVFKLYSYDARGNVLSMGSGVIISANGDAVTCGPVSYTHLDVYKRQDML